MDKDQIYLAEIKEFCAKIINFVQGYSFEQFVEDEKTHLSVVKLIENVGEAAKRLSNETKQNYPNVDWIKAGKMRDRLVHHYMDVDLAIVFDVATGEIPALLENLESTKP